MYRAPAIFHTELSTIRPSAREVKLFVVEGMGGSMSLGARNGAAGTLIASDKDGCSATKCGCGVPKEIRAHNPATKYRT